MGNAFKVVFSALGLFCALMLYAWIAQNIQKRRPLVAGVMMLPIAAFGFSLAPIICITLFFGPRVATYFFPVLLIASFVVAAAMLRKKPESER